MKTKLSQFSQTTLRAIAGFFVAGIGFGYYLYLNRPLEVKENIPANNAIAIHIAIAICLVITVIAIQLYRKRKNLPNIWTTPFSKRAFQRLKATFRPRPLTVGAVLRAAVCVPFLVIMMFVPFRIGAQFGSALDPSLPVNAWGGPSYLGATLAHAMDEIIFLYIAALILSIIMRKLPTQK